MNETLLMKGNEALAEASIRAGLDAYFGYPITPQSEILEYLSENFAPKGGVVLQAESELAAINMIYGASGAGARVMTTSSSPGISLMQEGLSYSTCAELPFLIVNVMRGGPGLGTIQPSQADYFQATKGGGHGDYHLIVLAPSTVQEMADFVFDGFALADKWRNPVMILADGALGQMMEKVTFREKIADLKKRIPKPWATTGKTKNRERNIITSLYIETELMENINIKLQDKYKRIYEEEVRFELINTDNADVIIVAFGLCARIAEKAIEIAAEKGLHAGLIRPITLYPFPYVVINQLAKKTNAIVVVEMNAGQMVEDVRLGVDGQIPVFFHGRLGGMIPSPEDIFHEAVKAAQKEKVHAMA